MKKFLLVFIITLFFSGGEIGFAKTIYTKDIIQNKSVITHLDVDSLRSGRVYEFFFRTIQNNIGQYWYVPVTVIKGRKSGKNVLIATGVHGNELNGLGVTALIKEKIKPSDLTGTVTIVHGVNTPGLINNLRGFKLSGSSGGKWIDLNRQFDSGKTGSADQQYATYLWNNLLKANVDYAIDLHTQGVGSHYPIFIYADFRNPEVATMAKLLGSDIIKMDNGEPGSVETSFVREGVPAVTFELGASERYQETIVNRATEGILNYLTHLKMLSGRVKQYPDTFIGNEWMYVRAKRGGYVMTKVKINDMVKKGDLLAVQYDAFGNVAEKYKAPVTGKVVVVRHFPTNEPGSTLVRIIYYNPGNATQTLDI